jgi:hypothetical protein
MENQDYIILPKLISSLGSLAYCYFASIQTLVLFAELEQRLQFLRFNKDTLQKEFHCFLSQGVVKLQKIDETLFALSAIWTIQI